MYDYIDYNYTYCCAALVVYYCVLILISGARISFNNYNQFMALQVLHYDCVRHFV